MYERFYGFREKPFSLLPDSGFLYLSSKHRMALTLLEYGLSSQAGFSVISGDIGTGKTTLIRQLLNEIDSTIRVGLISNTHRTFGELMQWIALAFNLPHTGKGKVELYEAFVEFIIGEYAKGRRTVLIVDEAQNMAPDTLEELRMLSNVNADKDQVLQVILVGQRELRETLRRPDLVQFAQRIGVDYHLEPLSDPETAEYIRHRCKVAGGRPDIFSDQACEAVYQWTGGVPRLINTLCDTALVYGYAEQRERIDATLVADVGRDKQSGGLFRPPAGAAHTDLPPAAAAPPQSTAATTGQPDAERSAQKKNLTVAIATESELFRNYLARLLKHFDINVAATLPLGLQDLIGLRGLNIDVLLVELDNRPERLDSNLYQLLHQWNQPVLFSDSLDTKASLARSDRLSYGRELCDKLYALVPHTRYVA